MSHGPTLTANECGEPFYWSASRLKRLLQCPRQFRYAYVQGLPTLLTAPLVFGRAMHEVIRQAHEAQMVAGILPPVTEIIESFDAMWQEALEGEEVLFRPSHPAPEKYARQGREMLRLFHRQNRDAAPPLAVELPFEVEMDVHLVRGVIDRLDEVTTEGGRRELVVIDYKSGNRRPTETELREDLQLTIYAFAVASILYREGEREREVARVELCRLRDGTRLTSQRDGCSFLDMEGYLGYAQRVREAGQYPPCPGYWCNWCDFRSQCEAEETVAAENAGVASGGGNDGLSG